jgi:hypothetical protein
VRKRKGDEEPSGVPNTAKAELLSSKVIVPAPAVQFAENPKNLPGPPKTSWFAVVLVILLAFISTGYVLMFYSYLLKVLPKEHSIIY